MKDHSDDDDFLSGCDILAAIPNDSDEYMDDEAAELFPLFARALDPNDDKSIEDVEAEWEEWNNAVSDGSDGSSS